MQIAEAADKLGLSARSLRHYEQVGLLSPPRDANGYRNYGVVELRRVRSIRDMIATGFSTREVLAMAPCLTDEGAGACEDGLANLEHKLSQIDKLIADLQSRRQATVDRTDSFRGALSHHSSERNSPDYDPPDNIAVSDRLSRRKR